MVTKVQSVIVENKAKRVRKGSKENKVLAGYLDFKVYLAVLVMLEIEELQVTKATGAYFHSFYRPTLNDFRDSGAHRYR